MIVIPTFTLIAAWLTYLTCYDPFEKRWERHPIYYFLAGVIIYLVLFAALIIHYSIDGA